MLGEITPSGREHFQGKLEAIHAAFKAHVAAHRPNLDVSKVADGDYWLASDALALGLVDEIAAGDEYLFRARDGARLYEIRSEARKSPLQQLLPGLGLAARRAIDFAMTRASGAA